MEKPDYHTQEEFLNRSKKLEEIRELGIDPYPHKYTPTASSEEILATYKDQPIGHSDDAASGSTPSVSMAGRLILFRAMGKNAFAHIQDEKGRIQILFNRDTTEVEGLNSTEITPLKFIEKKLDLGDIIGIEGNLFRTQKGEITLFAKKVTLLTKSLLPLPDKHSGLADKGTRYRKRWLDLIAHSDVKNKLLLRSKIVKRIRKYFDQAHFVEVETPILQNIYGGAEARPFTTNLNALHQEMFLRIAIEISLKKLLVGGIEKIYEIGKIFRNEGIDKTHNPEFTMLEAYAAYWDYNDMMSFVETLFETIALDLFGTTQIRLEGEEEATAHVIDLKTPWKRISMKDSIKEYANIDLSSLSEKEIREILRKETSLDPQEIEKATRGKLISFLFEEFVESHLIQPHHITDHPIETTPLCKLHRNPEEKKEQIVERFESFIFGREMVNAYSELNDPVLQRALLEKQAKQRLDGNEEAHPLDEDFIEAICQGMPPAGGVGVGIDRLIMLFTKASSIRDVIYFPILSHVDTPSKEKELTSPKSL